MELTNTVSELYKKRELLRTRLHQLKNQNEEDLAFKGKASAVSPPGTQGITDLRFKDRRDSETKGFRESRDTDYLLCLVKKVEDGAPLEASQVKSLQGLLERESDLLSEGLKGRCSSTANFYPHNLTLRNFCDFVTLPTLVYELEYPRTETVDWVYVAEKTSATFGIIVVMIAVSQSWIYPVVMSTVRMKEEGLTAQQRLQEFPWVLSDLLFPFMMEYLLAFYVIWECVVSRLE